MPDKLNHVDYRWYIVRTRPRQERKLAELLEQYKAKSVNILEVYTPTHTTVNIRHEGSERQAPLFVGTIFVLATQKALTDFMEEHSLNGILQYERKNGKGEKTRLRVIPEEQMRAFRDYNENYADRVIVLERPYTDYAFNAKSDEPNEIVRVIDGPLAGRKGYICRFRRDKRLVFRVCGMEPGSYLTVSYPNAWDLHVVRLHNAEGDRLSAGTEKGRAVDLLTGILQACGYSGQTLPMLYEITDRLSVKPSLVALCQDLYKKGDTALSQRLTQMSGKEAELILNLIRYERDNPGYVKANWNKASLRPFLTPTSGIEMEEGKDEAELPHTGFTEIIRKVGITEEVYYPSKEKEETVTTTYYAHIGKAPLTCGERAVNENGHSHPSPLMGKAGEGLNFIFFANWDTFLHEYFLTAGKAHEKLVGGTVQDEKEDGKKAKLIESFRNYAPTLYKVLTDADSPVKALQGFPIGNETLNVLAITATADHAEKAKNKLTDTCINICKEINTTTHLAVWRRYLRTVWLHE